MNPFGYKAFLRALGIFLSVLLVKAGIEIIAKTGDPFLRIIYSIGILVLILLMIIAPSFLPNRREASNKDGKPQK